MFVIWLLISYFKSRIDISFEEGISSGFYYLDYILAFIAETIMYKILIIYITGFTNTIIDNMVDIPNDKFYTEEEYCIYPEVSFPRSKAKTKVKKKDNVNNIYSIII